MNGVTTPTRIQCPYCGETIELVVEADLEGELVQDCEVCCHPWLLRVDRRGDLLDIEARRLED